MTDMKCPICGDEMKLTSLYMDGNHRYSHKYIGALSGSKDRCPFDGETLPLRALQEMHRTRKALETALDWLEQVATPEKCDDDLCREFTKRKLSEIKTALEQKDK